MKMSLPSFLTIALLAVPMTSPFFQSTANGQSPTFEHPGQFERPNQEDAQDDQGTPRVARLQSVQGDVSFQRAGDKEWVEAVTNLPLLTGDQIYTGNRSSAVIQLAHGSFIRLSEGTALAVTDLSEQGAQFEITSGSAVVQLYRLEEVFASFEVDTPVAAAVLQRDGVYRVQVQDNGDTEFATRDGLAEVTTEDASLKVRAGFRLQAGGKGSGKLDVLAIGSFDDWDMAGSPLDTTIDATSVIADPGSSPSPDYVGSYQDTYSSLYGLDELSGCGTWTNVASYGNCWIPRVGYGWAPYRSGRWLWEPAIGWTWLPSEPWGWAPYHYGRWSFIPGLGWAWVPGFGPQRVLYGYGYSYYAWRPGLVYFFNYSTPGGRYVGWQPLRPGEVWHRPGWYERHPNQAGWGRPIYHATNNGVSVLPIGAFSGSAAGRPEAPNHEHGRLLQGFDRPRPGAAPISAGLAGVQPGRFAGVPVPPVDGGKTFAMQPPSGIINRPVLTRHLPAGAATAVDDGNQVRRERRLVQPIAPVSQGPGRASGWSGDSTASSNAQGDETRGVKRHNPSLGDGPGSPGASPYTPGSGTEERRLRENPNSSGDDSPRHKNKGADQGQYSTEERNNQRHESPRYEAPANRPASRPEREAPKPGGGSGGSASNGSGNQYSSGSGHPEPRSDSHQNSGGSQNSGSGSHNNGQASGPSGHSGGQNFGSSTQGQPSKKN